MKRLFLLLSIMFLFVSCQTLSKKDDSFDESQLYEFVYGDGSKGYVYLADTLNGVHAKRKTHMYYDGKKFSYYGKKSESKKYNEYYIGNKYYFEITQYVKNEESGKYELTNKFNSSYTREDVIKYLIDDEFDINGYFIRIWNN